MAPGGVPYSAVNLVIAGPTAVGKSAFLSSLAAHLAGRVHDPKPIEAISADAFQAYRGMDIGTAKPDAELLDAVPHHLVDILDPSEPYSLADFVGKAKQAIGDIRSRGKIPVVCGGTAYYIRHLMLGVPEAPPSDPVIRESLAAEHTQRGLAAMFDELRIADTVSAARIHPNDSYRILRALEVYRLTGKPLSSFKKDGAADPSFRLVVLDRDRAVLHERIEERVRAMFSAGLEKELRSLVEAGFGPEDPGMKAIGYSEFFDDGGQLRDDPREIENDIVAHSRQYAKRQLTFFRSLPYANWMDAEDPALIPLVTGICYG